MSQYVGKSFMQLNRLTGLFEKKTPEPVNLNEKKKGSGKGSQFKMKILKGYRHNTIFKEKNDSTDFDADNFRVSFE